MDHMDQVKQPGHVELVQARQHESGHPLIRRWNPSTESLPTFDNYQQAETHLATVIRQAQTYIENLKLCNSKAGKSPMLLLPEGLNLCMNSTCDIRQRQELTCDQG